MKQKEYDYKTKMEIHNQTVGSISNNEIKEGVSYVEIKEGVSCIKIKDYTVTEEIRGNKLNKIKNEE